MNIVRDAQWHDMILSDRRIKGHRRIGEMGAAFCLENNKRNRVVDSEVMLELFRRNPAEFFHRYPTVDETQIHCYT